MFFVHDNHHRDLHLKALLNHRGRINLFNNQQTQLINNPGKPATQADRPTLKVSPA